MTFSLDAVCLPDVNVWIAAASDRHEHHATARPKSMSEDVLSPAGRSRSVVDYFPTNVCASNQNLPIGSVSATATRRQLDWQPGRRPDVAHPGAESAV